MSTDDPFSRPSWLRPPADPAVVFVWQCQYEYNPRWFDVFDEDDTLLHFDKLNDALDNQPTLTGPPRDLRLVRRSSSEQIVKVVGRLRVNH